MVAVLTKGTLTDPEMLASHSDASYIVALQEVPAAEHQPDHPLIGLCAVDCATGQMLLGSWCALHTHKRALMQPFSGHTSPLG